MYLNRQCCNDLSLIDVTEFVWFFFLCCEKFSSTCIDDEDISYFNKLRSSWLLNKRQINEVFNSYSLFCFPDHHP